MAGERAAAASHRMGLLPAAQNPAEGLVGRVHLPGACRSAGRQQDCVAGAKTEGLLLRVVDDPLVDLRALKAEVLALRHGLGIRVQAKPRTRPLVLAVLHSREALQVVNQQVQVKAVVQRRIDSDLAQGGRSQSRSGLGPSSAAAAGLERHAHEIECSEVAADRQFLQSVFAKVLSASGTQVRAIRAGKLPQGTVRQQVTRPDPVEPRTLGPLQRPQDGVTTVRRSSVPGLGGGGDAGNSDQPGAIFPGVASGGEGK